MGLLDNLQEEEIQEEKTISVKRDSRLDRILERYLNWFSEKRGGCGIEVFDGVDVSGMDVQCLIRKLTPEQDDIVQRRTGYFLTSMLQKAYILGENDFHIDVSGIDLKMDAIGYELEATEDRRIKLVVDGDVESYVGRYAKFVDFTFNGKVCIQAARAAYKCKFVFNDEAEGGMAMAARDSEFIFNAISHGCTYSEREWGGGAKDCIIIFNEDVVGGCFANYAERCKFIMNKNAGFSIGKRAEESTFIFKGKVGDDIGKGATYSTFIFEESPGSNSLKSARNCQVYFNEPLKPYCAVGIRSSNLYASNKESVETLRQVSGEKCKFYLKKKNGLYRPYGLKTNVLNLFKAKSYRKA